MNSLTLAILRCKNNMDTKFYILDEEHRVVEVGDMTTWGEFFETIENRRVSYTKLAKTGYIVSTVFLGLDHNFSVTETGGDYQPLVFETMVFDKDRDEKGCFRYNTWSQAIQGHETVVEQFAQKLGLVETSTGETLN